MDMPFAECADVELRWRPLGDDERARCSQLLADASLILANSMDSAGVAWRDEEAGGMLALTLEMVACNMVERAMKASVDMPAVTAYSQGAGEYSESFTYANPIGVLRK